MSIESEYRERMNRYSQETTSLSFVKATHPDFEALSSMGETIVPLLFKDLRDSQINDFPAGTVNPWALLYLLAKFFLDRGPKIEENERGKIDLLSRKWLAWGQNEGYL